MRVYELAAVKMAIKRSIKANNIQIGYNSIKNWANKWLEKGITVDIKAVLKCFNKWVKHNNKMGALNG